MIRVGHAPYDALTPFDPRVQTLRVYMELSTHYHKHTRKKNFRAEKLLLDIFQKKKTLFRNLLAKMGTCDRQHIKEAKDS